MAPARIGAPSSPAASKPSAWSRIGPSTSASAAGGPPAARPTITIALSDALLPAATSRFLTSLLTIAARPLSLVECWVLVRRGRRSGATRSAPLGCVLYRPVRTVGVQILVGLPCTSPASGVAATVVVSTYAKSTGSLGRAASLVCSSPLAAPLSSVELRAPSCRSQRRSRAPSPVACADPPSGRSAPTIVSPHDLPPGPPLDTSTSLPT